MTEEISEMMAKGAIQEASYRGRGFVSNVFLVPNKDGGQRPVINLKKLNEYVHTEHFKMEGIHLLKDLLRKGDWMTKVDLKDAYFMIPIHKQDRDFLKFTFKDKCYRFNCLPFGLACAPWVFTKVLKPLAAQLRELGVRLIVYTDDILILAETPQLLRDHTGPDLSPGEPGIYYWLQEMCARANAANKLSGVHGRLNEVRTSSTSREDQKDQGRGPKAKHFRLDSSKEAVPVLREIECSNKSSACGTSVLPQPPSSPGQSPGNGGTRLLNNRGNHSQYEGGAAMVGGPPLTMEWEDSGNRETLGSHRDGCFQPGLGSNVPGHSDGRSVVQDGVQNAYQLPGSTCSISGSQMFCAGSQECDSPAQNGQYECSYICEQTRRHGVAEPDSHSKGFMALVSTEGHNSHSRTLAGGAEHNCRRGVSCNERQDGLETEPRGVQPNRQATGPTSSGPICISAHQPTSTIFQLEARPRGRSHECLLPTMGQTRWEGLCQSPMESGGQNLIPSASSESNHSPGSAGMEDTGMVPHSSGNAGGFSHHVTLSSCRANTANNTNSDTGGGTSTSRMAYLRQQYKDEQISSAGTELLRASWRTKSSRSYDSLFGKWVCWCRERGADPISGPISDVVNFLAHLFEEGYQYRSLNSYRSAISSVHTKVDGYSIGEHPLVARLLKGAFNQRPPQPRYETTWDVAQVTQYFESLGENNKLSLQELTWKLAMLLSLTRPSRSSDLCSLDLNFRRYIPEGVTFQASSLAKQSKNNKPRSEFFFPAFPGSPRLCPVTTLRAYENRTKSLRVVETQSRLFLGVIRPHNPVAPSTMARWLRAVMEKAGIDTNIFKAHSTRGAATMAAANAGITTEDILKEADWSSDTVFQKFYYKPTKDVKFGQAVLTSQKCNSYKLP